MSIVGRWLGYEHIELRSPLPPEECARRLRDATERSDVSSTDPPVIGQVSESSFLLRKRLPLASRNSFQTYLTGKMAGTDVTWLSCRVGLHPFVIAFMAFWFLMLVTIGVGWVTAGVVQSPSSDNFAPGLLILPMMAAFGVGLVVVARRVARGEKTFLLGVLRDTIEARESKASSAPEAKTVERRSL
jgi:hypothetical protein